MNSDFPIVIDANVLMQAAVRDTLLRLAEQRLFLCRWSEDIIAEVHHNLIAKMNLPADKVDYLLGELHAYFPDAWVDAGYKILIPAMPNDEKDRHIVAAAVRCGAEVILTYNLKHFPDEQLKPLGIAAKTPDEYLVDLYGINPELIVHTLHQQGAELKKPLSIQEVLESLQTCRCVAFVELIRKALNL